MITATDYNTLLPPQPWELATCRSISLSLSQFRFTVSFVLSVVVGALFRWVPRGGENQMCAAQPAVADAAVALALTRSCAHCCRSPCFQRRHGIFAHLLSFWQWLHTCVYTVPACVPVHAPLPQALRHARLAHRVPVPGHGVSVWRAVRLCVMCFSHVVACLQARAASQRCNMEGENVECAFRAFCVPGVQRECECLSTLLIQEGHLDFTGAQMVLTLKLIAVAVRWVLAVRRCLSFMLHATMMSWDSIFGNQSHVLWRSYQDGVKEQLTEYAAQKQLLELPSLLEFFSYLFAAGNLLAGPFFEARDYFDYVDRKVPREGSRPTRGAVGKASLWRCTPLQGDWDDNDPAKRIPSPLLPGLLRFVKGVFCAVLWMKLSGRYGAGEIRSCVQYDAVAVVRK